MLFSGPSIIPHRSSRDLSDFRNLPEREQAMMAKSIDAYGKGDLKAALDSIAGVPEEIRDARLFIYRASLLLAVGRVDEAGQTLKRHSVPHQITAMPWHCNPSLPCAQREKRRRSIMAKKAVEADPSRHQHGLPSPTPSRQISTSKVPLTVWKRQ